MCQRVLAVVRRAAQRGAHRRRQHRMRAHARCSRFPRARSTRAAPARAWRRRSRPRTRCRRARDRRARTRSPRRRPARSSGRQACVSRNGAVRLTCCVRIHSSGVCCSNGCRPSNCAARVHDAVEPAAFALDRVGQIGVIAAASRRPGPSDRAPAAARRSSRSRRTALRARAPCARAARRSRRRAAAASAVARPRPPVAPVTSTTRSRSEPAAGDAGRPPHAATAACSGLLRVLDDARRARRDSYSSSVMSQPPISSPWMNSCGNVGQLE